MTDSLWDPIIREDLDFILNSDIDWPRLQGKTLLVTGAYGTLLSYLMFSLLYLMDRYPRLNLSVIAVVKNESKARQRLGPWLNHSLRLFCHDLASPLDLPGPIDYIIHGASPASPHQFIQDPLAVVIPNVLGTYYLLDLAKRKNAEGFLFFSSGAVYGRPMQGETVDETYFGYVDPLDVKNSYGESKRMAENMCVCWHAQYGIPVRIVRPAHVYGPTMDLDQDTRVVANFVRCLLRHQDILLTSQGNDKRSFCYVADATVAWWKVLFDGRSGEAYNVGNDEAYMTVRELADLCVRVFPERNLKVILPEKADSSRPDTSYRMLMSSRKLQKLGWGCHFPVPEGLKRTVASYELRGIR